MFRSWCLYISAANPSFMILPLKYYLNLPFLPPLFQRQTLISTLYRWKAQCRCGQIRLNFSGNPPFWHLPLKSQATSWPYLCEKIIGMQTNDRWLRWNNDSCRQLDELLSKGIYIQIKTWLLAPRRSLKNVKKLSQILILRVLTIKIRNLMEITAVFSHKLSWERIFRAFTIIGRG